MSDPILGLVMLGLIIFVIMLGFPTAFTLMGLGMMFGLWLFMTHRKAGLQTKYLLSWCKELSGV